MSSQECTADECSAGAEWRVRQDHAGGGPSVTVVVCGPHALAAAASAVVPRSAASLAVARWGPVVRAELTELAAERRQQYVQAVAGAADDEWAPR